MSCGFNSPEPTPFVPTRYIKTCTDVAVIVIFASRYDLSSRPLAAQWSAHDARLLTCDDLSVAGWRHYLNSDLNSENASTAVVDGKIVATEDISAVLIRWPGVFEQELTYIQVADRGYVAREMMAFLVSWLSGLKCPVINCPTPVNLSGPAWRLEQWTYTAANLGIPVRKAVRQVTHKRELNENSKLESQVSVSVVGDRCFGKVDESLLDQSRRLAVAAGVSLVGVSFSGPEAGSFFTGADLLPQLSEETADAVLDLLIRPGVDVS